MKNSTDLPRRVRTTDLTSPEWPSSTVRQLPFTMSHTTASSSPEAVMARLPQLAMAPSVSQPPCPAWSAAVRPSRVQLLHSMQCSAVQRQQTVGYIPCGAAGIMHAGEAHLSLMC